MRIVFFGTPDFAAFSLRKMVQSGFHVVAVVTSPDKPAGRGQKLQKSAVKMLAEELKIPVLQPTNLKSPDFIQEIEQLNSDLAVVIAFRMLPEKVWSAPRLGSMNLHGSLLPLYRGAAPIQHAIINGETETGVTTFFLKHEIDTGDIIERAKVKIDPNDNASSLHDKLMITGADVVIKSLGRIEKEGDDLQLIPQINEPSDSQLLQCKTAPKLSRSFCELTDLQSAIQVHNKIRGLSKYPCAWLISPWGEMKILESEPIILNPINPSNADNFEELLKLSNNISPIQSELPPNLQSTDLKPFMVDGTDLYILCGDGNFVRIKRLKLSGKSEIDGKSFVNGLKSKK